MHILVRKRRFLLTLNMIDVLCSVNLNFCTNEVIFKFCKRSFKNLKYYLNDVYI